MQAGAGAAQALGGSALTAIGCAGTAGAGCLGSALIGIPNSLAGADNVRAGLDTVLSGKPHATFGALALSQATGWRAEIAELVYGAGMASGPSALAFWQRTGKAVQVGQAAGKADDAVHVVAAVKVEGEVAANSASVTFGRVDNQISHTFRHIEAAGFDRSVVQSAITSDVSRLGNTFPTNLYNGSVIVNGTKLDYVAYRLSDGTLNIGRITPSR